ncbi:caspase family protein [Bifidobacterium simiarum]|nr:caspase family protein [Bifidobacterium simiarum]
MAQRLALFIGVGRYASAAYDSRQPRCCCTDAHAFAQMIRENSPRTPQPNFRLLGGRVYATPDPFDPTDPEMTADALTDRVHDLFRMVRRGDALLYFTGHAIPVDDGTDLLLLTPDDDQTAGPIQGTDETETVRRGIRVSDIRNAASSSQASSMTIILDCCHAGVAATMEWPRNTTILASTDEHTASQSLFGTHLMYTSALMAAMQGAAADVQGIITPLSLHSTVCALLNLGEDGQQPVLRTWNDTTTVLRQVEASRQITEEELARIAPDDAMTTRRRASTRTFDGMPLPAFEGFPTKDAAFAVHPEHESPTARDGVMRSGDETWEQLDGLQRDMELFKHLRNAKLLEAFIHETDGSTHEADLFWACMAEWDIERKEPSGRQGFVRLTDLGRLYWEIQHKR